MSGESSKTREPFHDQPVSILLAGNMEYTGYSDEEMTSDEDDGVWFPGDGVCPLTSQFDTVYQNSYNIWTSAASKFTQNGGVNPFRIDSFLDLLQDVPPFFHDPLRNVDLQERINCPLVLRSSLQLGTTEDFSCDQACKPVDYFQFLAFPKPMAYREATMLPSHFPSLTSGQPEYLTSIILAWSYILSSRWVEILQQADKKTWLTHDQGEHLTANFWALAIQSRWTAQVENDTGIFYAPWMLRKANSESSESCNMIQVPPDSYAAFDILVEFCVSRNLEDDLFTGLVAVLMITSLEARPLTLAAPIMISGPATSVKRREKYERLFKSIDKCMSISSIRHALDSLLCSAFFDSSVSCNLLGAVSLGIKDALLSAEDNHRTLLEAITERSPHLALLWRGGIRTGQAIPLLTIAMKDLPPICLVAALWTKTIQSFLQISYEPSWRSEISIPRSREFSTSYFCRPEASIPWSAAPPFGSTSIYNLSVEVQQHYGHNHRPLWWKPCWILDSGERVPATLQKWITPILIPLPWQDGQNEGLQDQYQQIQPHEHQKIADQQSRSATSRLFNWHRGYDDGLWLDDGTTYNIEVIRKFQRHPWIINPWDDGGKHSPLSEKKPSMLDRESILEWSAQVE